MDTPRLLKREFSPDTTGCEPYFTVRAKDHYSIIAVAAYAAQLQPTSDERKSVDEWIKCAIQWREENPNLCQTPTL